MYSQPPPGLSANSHSYKSIGSASPSSSTAQHTALYSLLNAMENTAKIVEKANPEKLATAGPNLAGITRVWHNMMTRVIYATEAAECKRIQHVQTQLDYDRVVEDKRKRDMDTLNRQAGAQMLQMQQDHHQELKGQKQAYENLLAKQVAKPSAPVAQDRQPGAKSAQSRTVKPPSPQLEDKIDCLANEITALNSKKKQD
ncbi:hypothetical protein G6011_05535 [Alternaria panax]|uniref:Uncharacterized protein n=1 Tax=Alternaria panax TaxID=48097 RepID=A0AAD4I923_9PLEO|nr:hypothetical protein G6011_05535 [Alternaria panax]